MIHRSAFLISTISKLLPFDIILVLSKCGSAVNQHQVYSHHEWHNCGWNIRYLPRFFLSCLYFSCWLYAKYTYDANPISVHVQISNLDTLASPIDSTSFWSIYSTCSFHYLPRDFIPFVLKHYGQSLQFGNKFIYQSMPRLLTIWLDFGATVSDQGNV